MDIPFALGEALVGVLAWLIPDWRYFQYITSAPLFMLLLIHFVIPESPRWLISKQRYKELNSLVKKIGKTNKVQIPDDIKTSLSEAMLHEPEHSSSIFRVKTWFSCAKKEAKNSRQDNAISQLFSNPILRTNTLVMFANWAIVVLGW